MNLHQANRSTAPLGTLERHLQESEQAKAVSDKAEHHLESYLRNILLGDIGELLQELANDDEACKRIQVNILTDITEVGRIVRAALIDHFHEMAQRDAETEAEE